MKLTRQEAIETLVELARITDTFAEGSREALKRWGKSRSCQYIRANERASLNLSLRRAAAIRLLIANEDALIEAIQAVQVILTPKATHCHTPLRNALKFAGVKTNPFA